jgi:hypothetical protein
MNIGQVIRFHDEHFFDGAVQLGWLQRRIEQARQAASAFVFHGPRYHGAAEAEHEGVEGTYRLKDTASFVRDLLGSMRAGAEGREVNPYWLVVAGYGAGKSHLALTCATLLSEPGEGTAQTIVDQIAQSDAEIGKTVAQQVAEMKKPALVLPLDGMAGFHLGNALSRAVFVQLEYHGIDAEAIRDLSPRFQTADQFVERNFTVRADRFAARLPALDAAQIQVRLRQNDEEVYSAVDALYMEANGHHIPLEGQESAQDLIDTLCSAYCGKDGPFSHVVILFDELGRYLEYAAEKPQLAGDAALQQIFQGVQDNSDKVRFVGFIQYELKAYLKRFSGGDLRQLQRYVTRFDTADKWYLSTNLETIFAHMIGKNEAALAKLWKRTHAERKNEVTRQHLAKCLPGFARFPVWNDPERFARVIGQGCWPLHPFAVWFLTRQRDLVQSRSALTFIKDVIERISGDATEVDGRLRQVSAADLVVGSMLPELVAAERETGGVTAETLQTLLEKFRGHFNPQQQLVLAGVAVLEKTRIGKQTRQMADSLLCEAAALEATALPALLAALSELGAVEWNSDLGQYELLSDGATRGQFQQLLRAKQGGFNAAGIRDLFIRRGARDFELRSVTSDFAQKSEISTPDWLFEALLAHSGTVENVIHGAFQEWHQATLPKDAKGKLIYLYLHQDEDPSAVGNHVQACLDAELERVAQPQAPIWVIAIADHRGALAEHIVRLFLYEEKLSVIDQERFRRFIPDERDRSLRALKDGGQEAIKEQHYWIAGFDMVPAGRLEVVGQKIFSRVYSEAVPFPFDGFASASGGGPADATQLARGLIARQVTGAWVQALPVRLQNRVDAVLINSWKALRRSGELVPPSDARVRIPFQRLEKAHQENPQLTLLASYRALIAPPYGLNASSASLLLGLLLGLDSPPRRIEHNGVLVASTDWLALAFPSKQGKHYLDEAVLAKSRIRFLSADSESRWRGLLQRWEAEENYGSKISLAREAAQMREIDPLPEMLEGNYNYLRDDSKRAAEIVLGLENRIRDWEREIELATRKARVDHAIKLGGMVLDQRNAMQDSPLWPVKYVDECNGLLVFVNEVIIHGIAAWIPRQSCENAVQVGEFRRRTENQARWLVGLGFAAQAQALDQQAQRCIHTVEARQRFALTLAQCNDYPRQPEPTDSTSVRSLRDEIALGDSLVLGLQGAVGTLAPAEITAHTNAIQQRQINLRTACKRQEDALAAVFKLTLQSQDDLHEALTKVNRLRDVFVGTRDESEVSEIAAQLERILSDTRSWEIGDTSVDRLNDLLTHQSELQLVGMKVFLESREMDPVWDMAAIYQSLANERLEAARRRSAEWISPRLALAPQIASFDRSRCVDLERELSAVPAYLAAQHAAEVGELLAAVQRRRADLEELERRAQVAAWHGIFLRIPDIECLDTSTTERLLERIRTPPCELHPEEKSQVAPIALRLTAHLDRLSLDDLFARIGRLSEPQKRQIFVRLSTLLGQQRAQH